MTPLVIGQDTGFESSAEKKTGTVITHKAIVGFNAVGVEDKNEIKKREET